MRLSVFPLFLFAGCAMADPAEDDPRDDMSMIDQSLTADASQVPVDLKPGCVPLINEIMTTSSSAASYEFIELFNPCNSDIDLAGWSLVYRSWDNAQPSTPPDPSSGILYTFSATPLLLFPAGGYLVFGGAAACSGDGGICDYQLAYGLRTEKGSVGLRNNLAQLVGSVAYGAVSSTNAFIEVQPAPEPVAGHSISRCPNGADSHDNSKDFKATPTISPGAINSCS